MHNIWFKWDSENYFRFFTVSKCHDVYSSFLLPLLPTLPSFVSMYSEDWFIDLKKKSSFFYVYEICIGKKYYRCDGKAQETAFQCNMQRNMNATLLSRQKFSSNAREKKNWKSKKRLKMHNHRTRCFLSDLLHKVTLMYKQTLETQLVGIPIHSRSCIICIGKIVWMSGTLYEV